KYQLAQESKMEIDRAKKSLDNKFGDIVTKIQEADNLKSEYGVNNLDASQISKIHSSPTGNSNTETVNVKKENQPNVSAKSDIHLAPAPIIAEGLHPATKIHLKADAGQRQEVIEGTMVTLDGGKSKIGDATGLSYSWEQVGGPKVRIVGTDTPIASFEAPKLPSAGNKLTLKFVLLIKDDSGSTGRINNNNAKDKDSVLVIVKQEPSLDHNQELSSSANNRDRSTSQDKDKILHSNDAKDIDDNNGDGTKLVDNGKAEETKNEESAPQPDNVSPIESPQVDNNNSDTFS
ncbi:MAG: hypothetical protein ABJB85_10840, partial [Nitrososphaerota archaeon]